MTDPASALPPALMDGSAQELDAFDRQDAALMAQLRELRVQRAALSLARVFEAHPQLREIRLRRVDDLLGREFLPFPDSASHPLFALSNRGACLFFEHSDDPLEDYLRYASGSALVGQDPDAGEIPGDKAVRQDLYEWIRSNRSEALQSIFLIRFERPADSSEPLPHALLRQALSPAAFARWESSAFEHRAEPSARRSSPSL